MNTSLSRRRWPWVLTFSLLCGLACTDARTLSQRQRTKGSSNTLQWHSRKLAESSSVHRKTRHMSSSSPTSSGGKGKSGSHAGYLGCLGLSSDDLQQSWIFQGQAASCSYTYHTGKGKGKGKGRRKKWQWWNNGGSDDDSTSGSGSSGGSGGGGGGDDDNSSSSGGTDDNSSGGNDDNGGGGNGGNGGGGNDDNGGGGGDGYVDDGDVDNRDGQKDNYDDDANAPYDGQEVSNEDFGNVDESDDDYYYVRDDDNGGAGGDDEAGGGGQGGDDAAAGGDQGGDDAAAGGGQGDDDGNGNDDANGGGGDNGGNGADGDAVDQQNIEGVNSYDPYASFDIESCDSYENLWLWDLSLSCESDVSLDTCECTFAEELIEEGYMTCESMRRNCPSNCQICRTCANIMGCTGTLGVDTVIAQSQFFILVAAVGVLCCGLTYYYARRRGRNTNSEMAAHLMMSDDDDYGEEPVWLAPDIPAPIMSDKEYGALQQKNPRAQPANEPNVWLAPTVVPFDRHRKATQTSHTNNLLADHAELDPADGEDDVLPSPSTASIYFDNDGLRAGESMSIASDSVGDDIASIEQRPSALDGVTSYDDNDDGPTVWLAPAGVQFQPSHDAAMYEGENEGSNGDGVWLAPVV